MRLVGSLLLVGLGFGLGLAVLPVSAGGGNAQLSLPLTFSERQFEGVLYVDEVHYGRPTLVYKSVSAYFPESPQYKEVGSACFDSQRQDLYALAFGGQPSNWSGGYPRYGYSTMVFESKTPTQLNIQFGQFWNVKDGDIFDSSKPADASAKNPVIVTTRGVWLCSSPR